MPASKSKWKIHKFGGTSVLNAERYQNVYKIITNSTHQTNAIVLSAMKGVTDDLIRCVQNASAQNNVYKKILEDILNRHIREVTTLLPPAKADLLLARITKDIEELAEILRGVWLVKTASASIIELVSGMGEVWSAQIFNAFLLSQNKKSVYLDARKVLVVEHENNRVVINWELSDQKLKAFLEKNPSDILVITGFVAATSDGTITTLGRNGSDYSASIFGALLDCDDIYIWTDVDGVLSADPRLVPEAIVLDEMSYSEITELAYFGAKVVHPATMAPAMAKQITIWIKNTFKPFLPGTKIYPGAKSNRTVKGFSIIDKMSLFNIEGTGMVGIPGVAERLFGSLRSSGVSVVLISQASSEQSVCFSIPEDQSELAQKAVNQVFYAEIQQGLIQNVQITRDVSILAVVGDNMAHSPGIAGQFFTALGKIGVNIKAIAQGSSERNISVVIDSKDAIKALRTVHSSFILPHQSISVGLIGPGLIGGTFLKQLNGQLESLRTLRGIDIQVRGIANSKKMLISDTPIDLNNWSELLEKNSESLSLEKFSAHIKPNHIAHSVIIEATASASLTPYYKDWLSMGIHLISPNKKANTSSLADYNELRRISKKSHGHFLYSTNVGAGLPVIQTLKDLCATGDEIELIQGVLSGTLSYIFNQFDGSRAFSEIVLMAKEQGYTEPDPREDLSGQDVMRKLVILAREMGLQIEPGDVEVQGLVPKNLQDISTSDFLARVNEMDSLMSEKIKKAKEQNEILRFVGTIEKNGKARVSLENLPAQHSFSKITGSDNIVLFKTKRYFNQALVIQGPGAGPEVTAAGVFADLLRLSQYVGATS